jgi:hypothetical protein
MSYPGPQIFCSNIRCFFPPAFKQAEWVRRFHSALSYPALSPPQVTPPSPNIMRAESPAAYPSCPPPGIVCSQLMRAQRREQEALSRAAPGGKDLLGIARGGCKKKGCECVGYVQRHTSNAVLLQVYSSLVLDTRPVVATRL